MEERREAPPPDDDNNNNKPNSAASRCAFAHRFVGLAPAGCPGPFLIDDASLSTSTLTAAGRGRPDDAPLTSSLYNYYVV
jgi:hypothetical protein